MHKFQMRHKFPLTFGKGGIQTHNLRQIVKVTRIDVCCNVIQILIIIFHDKYVIDRWFQTETYEEQILTKKTSRAA